VISPRPLFVGAAAALVAPWHLEGDRLKRLVEPVPAGRPGTAARSAVRVARGTIRVLSRLPFSPWRNTCLYRAVAGCLAARWLGGDVELYLLDLEDRSVRRLTEREGSDGYPAWLPDGRIVYVAYTGSTPELRWLDPAAPGVTHPIPLPGRPGNPVAMP